MDSGNLVPITLFLCAALIVIGLRYLSNKEKMAMIERGIDPGVKRPGASAPRPFLSLKFGLLLVGLGIGLIVALFTVKLANIQRDEAVALYFGCLSIFGGLGLIVSYVVEKAWLDKNLPKEGL